MNHWYILLTFSLLRGFVKKCLYISTKVWCTIDEINWYENITKYIGNALTDEEFLNSSVFSKCSKSYYGNNPTDSHDNKALHETIFTMIF